MQSPAHRRGCSRHGAEHLEQLGPRQPVLGAEALGTGSLSSRAPAHPRKSALPAACPDSSETCRLAAGFFHSGRHRSCTEQQPWGWAQCSRPGERGHTHNSKQKLLLLAAPADRTAAGRASRTVLLLCSRPARQMQPLERRGTAASDQKGAPTRQHAGQHLQRSLWPR